MLAGLPRPNDERLRWTTSEQWHVTLRFLGEVTEDEVPVVVEALTSVVQARSPVQAVVGPVTARLGPGVLVAPVSGLDDLAGAVAEATGRLGQPEPRPFSGHVTLARGRGRRPVPPSLAGQALSAGWDVGELALVRSRIDGNGARYDTLNALRLVPARPRP